MDAKKSFYESILIKTFSEVKRYLEEIEGDTKFVIFNFDFESSLPTVIHCKSIKSAFSVMWDLASTKIETPTRPHIYHVSLWQIHKEKFATKVCYSEDKYTHKQMTEIKDADYLMASLFRGIDNAFESKIKEAKWQQFQSKKPSYFDIMHWEFGDI